MQKLDQMGLRARKT